MRKRWRLPWWLLDAAIGLALLLMAGYIALDVKPPRWLGITGLLALFYVQVRVTIDALRDCFARNKQT